MTRTTYAVGKYRDPDSGRQRFAVWASPAQIWYFPDRYGRAAADRLAARLNLEASR